MISKSIRKKPNRGYFISAKRERISVLNKKAFGKKNTINKNVVKPNPNSDVVKNSKLTRNKIGDKVVVGVFDKKEPVQEKNTNNAETVNSVELINKTNEHPSGAVALPKNKTENSDNNMNTQTLEEINDIISDNELNLGARKPKRKIKMEKKEKGLLERTEDSTILITEDNKTLLTD